MYKNQVTMKHLNFSLADYISFTLMLTVSVIIGIYYGCFGKKQQTTADYLLGGKKMKAFPVAMSLVASSLSGISLLGIPAEIYLYGTQFIMMMVAIIFAGVVVNFVYMPVFWKLQITSVFDYLELRFGKTSRVAASVTFTFTNLMILPTIIYAPSLALNQVTGFDLHLIAVFMSLICLFYATLGGLKAIVSADTMQFSVTLCTLVCVFVMGAIAVGGFSSTWTKAKFGDRLEFFNINPDPTIRTTFWCVLVGGIFNWMAYTGISPPITQRFLSVSSLNESRKVLIIYITFTVITMSICCFFGLIMYAKYDDCDPLTAGRMQRPDQIMPFFVMDVAAQIPSLRGLFVAGLFSMSLSTLSTFLNALSGIFYKNFLAPFMPKGTTERTASNIMKLLTVLIGFVSVALIFVIERLGTIMELVGTFNGITMGPLLGFFTLGMLFPMANEKGSLFGVASSLLLMAVTVFKYQTYMWNGAIKHVRKPFYTFGCNKALNAVSNITIFNSTTAPTTKLSNEVHWMFRISFFYYILIGTVTTLVIGLCASWITQEGDAFPLDLNLLSPCVHRFYTRSARKARMESAGHEFQVFKVEQRKSIDDVNESADSKLLK